MMCENIFAPSELWFLSVCREVDGIALAMRDEGGNIRRLAQMTRAMSTVLADGAI